MQNSKKNTRIDAYHFVLIIITLVFLVFMFSGITLSKMDTNNKENKQVDAIVFNVGDLAINYIDGNKIDLEYPNQKEYKYNFSITNTSSNKIYYTVYLKDTKITNKNIKIKLLNSEKKEIYHDKLIPGENLLNSVTLIEPNTTDRYTLVLENKKNRSKINSIITIENESLNKNTLQDLILKDNIFNISSKTKIGDIAIEDEGLIKESDDYGTTYYFRGNVQKNYLKIQDRIFRIIRINGDGTIRAILEDYIPEEYQFNTNEVENDNNLVILEKSNIINILNNWITNNIGNYEDLLVASSFCSDPNFDTIKDNVKYSKTYERINNNNPTFKCFSNTYLSKVGLISPDEVILAGGSIYNDNDKYYLYNSNLSFDSWTTGSFSIDSAINMYSLTGNGSLIKSDIKSLLHIRPVINISSSAIAKGEGTKDNPYILVK